MKNGYRESFSVTHHQAMPVIDWYHQNMHTDAELILICTEYLHGLDCGEESNR